MTDAQAAIGAGDAAVPADPTRPGRRRARGVPALLWLTLLSANVCVAAGLHYPVVVPALGMFLLVALPTALLVVKVDWRATHLAERLGYSLATTLLLLMSGGLAINTILPPLGVSDALGRIPVLVLGDALVAGLLIWRRGRFAWWPARWIWSMRLTLAERTVTRLSVGCVPLAAVGANRLNNGAGGAVAMAALAAIFLTLLLVFLWRGRLDPGVITFVIYMLALGLLLATSLRGWYTTGHDIQREYRVFELTKTNGNWSISRYRGAYNACLSITILPTMLWEITKVHDPYVYKVLYQAMFALCPVLVYRLSLRFTSTTISLIGVAYLLCFPTFSNDMPFLNRQEIAFLFISAMLLVLTNDAMTIRQKRAWTSAFSLGLIVSHYSSAAVFIATVIVADLLRRALPVAGRCLTWTGRRLRRASLVDAGARLGARQRRRGQDEDGRCALAGPPRSPPVFGLMTIAILVIGAALWIGLITRTGTTIRTTVDSAVSSIGQSFSFSAKSSDVAYNLFSFSQPSNAQLLSEYRAQTIAETSDRGGFYPLSAIDKNGPAPAVNVVAAPTALGRYLSDAGVNVTDLSTVIHGLAAKLLQLLVLVGLIAAPFEARGRFRMDREPYLFSVATLFLLVAVVIVPVVSENYGILRAFMQALLILSPLVAYGGVVVFGKLGERWASRIAIVVALFLFVNLSGLVPQLLGGYQQQLSLNNAGLYYDVYYPRTQEVVAINWLRTHIPAALQTSVQSEVVTDQYEFQRLKIYSGINVRNDIYPTLLRVNSYVYLSNTTVQQGLAVFVFKGNLVIYHYPISFLLQAKDLIFDDGGAEVYR